MQREGQEEADADTGLCRPKPSNAKVAGSYHELGERQATDSPSEPAERTSPANFLTWDFGLENDEKVNVCCSKPPALW